MADLIKIEEMEDYLRCIAEEFDYTSKNLLTFFKAVFKASRDTGKNLIFIDFTAIHENTPATLKSLAGILAKGMLQDFHRDVGRLPRIAVFGVTPHILDYKPAQEILRNAGMPVAVFTDEAAAKEWLFKEGKA